MHERSLMQGVLRRVLQAAEVEGADRVTRIQVWLGALSHFSPAHFKDHFDDVAGGTAAEGARIDATVSDDPDHPDAQGVRVEAIDVE